MLPSLFIAHGSPMLAVESNEYTEFVKKLGKSMPRPKAIVLFSAHWESTVQQVGNAAEFSTIHDFGGFSEELFSIQYPAKGSTDAAGEVVKQLRNEEIPLSVNPSRGLDHGAWVILRMLYPNADIPVVSMSVNPQLSPEQQYKIGQSLSALREKDFLIIGSGGTVHNLRALNWRKAQGEADDWALAFDNWLEVHIKNWDLESLFQYEALAPAAQAAVPPFGNEHFIPLFYAMGAADNQRTANLLHRSYQYGNLSHSVWQFGK